MTNACRCRKHPTFAIMHMKSIFYRYTCAALLALSLISCNNKEKAPPPSPEMVKQVVIAQQKAELTEKQLRDEERKRHEAEQQRQAAEEGKAKAEQNNVWMLVCVALALFAGIAIGSSSRKDAAKKRTTDE